MERYEPFFGLTEAPFSLAPDPRFLFASASLSAALAQLAYALERREPLVVVTGEIGTGKTLLCRAVLQRMQRKTFLSVIHDPLLGCDDLLKQLLEDFGVIAKDRTRLTQTSRHELIDALHAFLRSLRAIQAHAVVIIDEAQHLQPDVLEQIRLLSNIDDERGTLLQIILVGQTELGELLARPELRQLQQRVSRRFRLEPLNKDEVHRYINHRLTLARDGIGSGTPGAADLASALAEWARTGSNAAVEFTPGALQAVTELSHGLPRVINLLCDRSLEEACASQQYIVDVPLIHRAAHALGIAPQAPPGTTAGPFWALTQSESAAPDNAQEPTNEAGPINPEVLAPAAVSARLPKYWLLASSLAAAAVVFIWFSVRDGFAPTTAPPRSAVSRPRPAAAAAPTRPATPPAAMETPVPPAAVTPAAPAPAAGEGFDIVVASFRTDERAAAVASVVSTLGLPVRRRVADGWQQVVSGPFAARIDADEAQERLNRAGLTGTRIVRAVR